MPSSPLPLSRVYGLEFEWKFAESLSGNRVRVKDQGAHGQRSADFMVDPGRLCQCRMVFGAGRVESEVGVRKSEVGFGVLCLGFALSNRKNQSALGESDRWRARLPIRFSLSIADRGAIQSAHSGSVLDPTLGGFLERVARVIAALSAPGCLGLDAAIATVTSMRAST